MVSDDREPDGFDAEHAKQKQRRKSRRGKDQRTDDQRLRRVGKKDCWRYNPTKDYDDE